MTTLARPTSQVERLRAFARQFADALPVPNRLQDEAAARAFWVVLLALVVDDACVATDLTGDLVIAIYATAVAADFIDQDGDAS